MRNPKYSFVRVLANLVAGSGLLVGAPAFAGSVTTDGPDLAINTNSGVSLHTLDNSFSFSLDGLVQWDAEAFAGLAAASQKQPFARTTNTFMRRGELDFYGTAFTDYGYGLRLSYNGLTGGTQVDRSFVIYKGLSWAAVTIGQFGIDYGMENATGAQAITGSERPILYDFSNGAQDTRFGINVMHKEANYGLMAQIANYKSSRESTGNNELLGTVLRANYAPYLSGTNVLHFGADFFNAHPGGNAALASSRLGIRSNNDDQFVFGNVANAERDYEWMLESALQYDGFRAQGEYFARRISGSSANGVTPENVFISGYYEQVSYMFNGARRYLAGYGKWDRPQTKNAVEVFARYERNNVKANAGATPAQLDTQVNGVVVQQPGQPFRIQSWTVGVDYFPNPNVRTTLDYKRYTVGNINTSAEIQGTEVKNNAWSIVGRLQYFF